MSLLDDEDPEIQKCAAQCIHNLAADSDLAERLEACVPALVNLLGGADPRADAKLHAVAALRGLAVKV